MTEFSAKFRDDEPDEEDLLLRGAIVGLQEIVTDFMLRTGRSLNELSQAEQQALVDQIDPHLKFEIQASEDIYKGMPIVLQGAGAFLITDQQNELLGAQLTLPGDVITGVVAEVQAYPVPTREVVLNTGPNDEIPTYDLSLSAVVIIEGAQFYSSPSSDGTFQATHDLSAYNVVIPAVYDMDARVADIVA